MYFMSGSDDKHLQKYCFSLTKTTALYIVKSMSFTSVQSKVKQKHYYVHIYIGRLCVNIVVMFFLYKSICHQWHLKVTGSNGFECILCLEMMTSTYKNVVFIN